MGKPIIGISSRYISDDASPPAIYGARVSYADGVIAAGGVPFLIPFTEEEDAIRDAFNAIDGLVLPGGEDVDPRYYGQTRHESVTDCVPLRDKIDLALAKLAYHEKKPVFGICRGLQVMNVALGGTLIQDIPSSCPSEVNHLNNDFPEAWARLAHPIEVIPGTKLAAIIGAGPVMVNSIHHQSIDRLASGLIVSATAADGIIEAVEAPEHPFLVAIQAHPEILWSSMLQWKQVFKAFVAACT